MSLFNNTSITSLVISVMQPIIREFFIEFEISEFKKCVLTLVCANLEFFSRGWSEWYLNLQGGGGFPRYIFVSFLHVCKFFFFKLNFPRGFRAPDPPLYLLAAFRHNIRSKDVKIGNSYMLYLTVHLSPFHPAVHLHLLFRHFPPFRQGWLHRPEST